MKVISTSLGELTPIEDDESDKLVPDPINLTDEIDDTEDAFEDYLNTQKEEPKDDDLE